MCLRQCVPPLNSLAWQSQISPLAFLH
ncbi:hypothetical protein TSAR_000273 [Trichomalopsis sarcophagae]|uniref:Uncharacterized protein n=1 Tax=Trichomalopsis sarcophagae TaxID=543379 RepID=A0A232EIZ4_9HYME|nr:hypothetical protein TSAR_000273 [Trichomalopsis sarcophagae]